MFNEENVISLAIFLSFCPSTSVYPNLVSHELVKYKKDLLNGPYFFAKFLSLSHNFLFSKFSHFCFAIFSHYFVRSFSQNFNISYFAKVFAFFVSKWKTKKCQIWTNIFFGKNAKFSRTDVSFSLETLVMVGHPHKQRLLHYIL